MHKKIKWGILGLGGIAHKFAKDLLLVEDAEIFAVALDRSRRQSNLKRRMAPPMPMEIMRHFFPMRR